MSLNNNKAGISSSFDQVEQDSHEPSILPEAPEDNFRFENLDCHRILMYSHDTLGLGHLKRSLKIASALVSMIPGLTVRIVTGSTQADRFKFPENVDYVLLPPVRKAGPEHYEAREANLPFEVILKQRKAILLNTVVDFKPELIVVDHAPLGMEGELLLALEWHALNIPGSIRIFGMRDIVDDPDVVAELWNRKNIYKEIDRLYDHILIYGSPSVFDAVNEYRFPSVLRAKSYYCNYIADSGSNSVDEVSSRKLDGARGQVLVTIGGGDGAADVVIGNYLEMLRLKADSVNWDSRILVGPFLDKVSYSRLRKSGEGLPVRFESFVNDMQSLMRSADLVISTGGYNTVTEVLAYAQRSIVIPRIMYRMEQLIRADCLAKKGLLKVLHPNKVTPDLMFEAVTAMLSNDDAALEKARRKELIQFDGAKRLAFFAAEQLYRLKLKEKVNG